MTTSKHTGISCCAMCVKYKYKEQMLVVLDLNDTMTPPEKEKIFKRLIFCIFVWQRFEVVSILTFAHRDVKIQSPTVKIWV